MEMLRHSSNWHWPTSMMKEVSLSAYVNERASVFFLL